MRADIKGPHLDFLGRGPTAFHTALWLFTLMWNDFFFDAATNLKEREIFLVEPVSSLKLVCNLKHLSRKQFHNTVLLKAILQF